MHLDPYISKNSMLHRLDARAKLPLTAAFILTLALFEKITLPVFLLMFGLLVGSAILSEIEAGILLRRIFLASPFLFAALPLPFTTPGATAIHISLGSLNLTASQPGLVQLLNIAVKFWLSMGAAVLLSASTPINELLNAMRAIHIPRLLVSIMSMMWRYLALLVNESKRLSMARNARSGRSVSATSRGGGSLIWRARVTGGMAGSLMLRSFDRSDRVYAAMLARGYNGEVKSISQKMMDSISRRVLTAGLILFVFILFVELLSGT